MNPSNPAAPAAPPTPPVSDSAAMAGVIGGLGPAPAAPEIPIDFGVGDQELINPEQPPAPPMFNPPVPVVPPAPPVTSAAPAAPAPPAFDPNAIPLPAAPPAYPSAAPADQVPAWAQTLMSEVQALKQAPAQGAEWKPDGWGEVDARIEERARALVRQGLTEVQAANQAQAQESADMQTKANQFIDGQINQLEQTGYLPKIANPNDASDPGRLAHNELFSYALSLGTDNLLAVAPTLYAHHQAGYYYDRGQNKLVRRGSQSAAAQAPIAGASPTLTAPAAGGTGPSLRDLANKDLYTIAEEANRAFPLS